MQEKEKWLDPTELRLDLKNPRMPDEGFVDEDSALEWLVDEASLDELIQSIASSGWIDYEPLIVLSRTSEVIEGNRRLAALRLLSDPSRAKRLGVKIPQSVHDRAVPDQVRVWLVDDKKDARDFIGFKHINGPFKWDAFAKAKYAAEWLADDGEIIEVAHRLGDTHNTIVRLVNGYKVLRQAENLGFDRRDISGRFSFSHLYTALARPNYRHYLGLPESTGLLEDNPVDNAHRDELIQLLIWLYGQDRQPAVIRSQNPDLKRLAEVLPNRTAVAMLAHEPNLDAAHAQVEDKGELFAEAIYALSAAAKNAIALSGNYEGGDADLEAFVANIVRTVRGIQATMQTPNEGTG